jgi:predicted metal-binding membrane protein
VPLVLIVCCLLAWVVLLVNPGNIMTMEHCHVSAAGPSAKSLSMLLYMNPFSSQLMGWGWMVVAMMLPKLSQPVEAICRQSLKRNRLPLSILFVLGYVYTWIVAGIFFVAIIIALNLLMPLSYIPAVVVFLIALVWQFSPVKQRLLNLGHAHAVLPAFGWRPFRDALLFGVQHGLWCVGAGWALMLFPMLLPAGHNLAMIVVTFIMLSEHMENPRYPQWQFTLRLKLFRLLFAQAKLKLAAVDKR